VDKVDHALPQPEAPTPEPQGGDEPPVISRSVSLSCPTLGLTAKLDLVSTLGDEAVPVETKRGKVPDIPGNAWEPEKVQLMAQALLLRAHGYTSDHGWLYFAASRRRVEVPFSPELEARTLDLLRQAHLQQKSTVIPDPLDDSPKCKGCSLAGICLPDETLALREVPTDAAAPSVRRLYPPRDESAPLYVQEQGAWIGTSKGRLMIKKEGVVLNDACLKDHDHLVICGNVQIGTQAVHLLAEAGIPIVYLSTGHWFYAMTQGIHLRNAYDRAAQYAIASDSERSLGFARAVVAAKIQNQRTLLRRNADGVPDEILTSLAKNAVKAASVQDAQSLLGIEGTAARDYFCIFPSMLKDAELAKGFTAEGRSRRPPPDPVNALLSFCYAMLAKDCSVALMGVGLDPWWGLYHRPRHGRPALALDLMEEFRPLIADSAVITALNTGMLSRSDFIIGRNGCQLKDTGRKAIIRAFEARCEQLATHPTLGYKVSWRVMIRLQARLLARWLRGDLPIYQGVTTR
jgi:CRISPR-associated protein Cas1